MNQNECELLELLQMIHYQHLVDQLWCSTSHVHYMNIKQMLKQIMENLLCSCREGSTPTFCDVIDLQRAIEIIALEKTPS